MNYDAMSIPTGGILALSNRHVTVWRNVCREAPRRLGFLLDAALGFCCTAAGRRTEDSVISTTKTTSNVQNVSKHVIIGREHGM